MIPQLFRRNRHRHVDLDASVLHRFKLYKHLDETIGLGALYALCLTPELTVHLHRH
jgi:hypothetical protein